MPSVHRDPGDAAEPLHRADAVERDTRLTDERAARLEHDRRRRRGRCALQARDTPSATARTDLTERELRLLEHVPNGEAATDVDEPRSPVELVATAHGERREALDRRVVRLRIGELRAHMDVQAGDVEPESASSIDGAQRGIGRKAELRAVVTRPDRLVGIGLDAERDADEDARHP